MSTVITSKRAALISQGATLSNQIKALEKQLGFIKDALEGLDAGTYSVPMADGIEAQVLIKEGTRVTLDSKVVKSFLTPAQVIEASRESEFRSYGFSTKVTAVEAIAA